MIKRFTCLCLSIFCMVFLALPAFATETEGDTGETPAGETTTGEETTPEETPVEETETTTGEDETEPETTGEDETTTITEEEEEELPVVETYVPTSSPTVYTVVSTNEAETPDSTLAAYLTDIFGEYTPRTQIVTQSYTDGSMVTYEEYVPGLAGLDWVWLSSVGLFGLFAYCVLRIVGGILSWK